MIKNFISTTKYKVQDKKALKQLILPVRRFVKLNKGILNEKILYRMPQVEMEIHTHLQNHTIQIHFKKKVL